MAAARCDSEETPQKPPPDSRSLIPDPYGPPLGARREPILCRIDCHVQLGVPILVQDRAASVRSESEREATGCGPWFARRGIMKNAPEFHRGAAGGLDRTAEPDSRVDLSGQGLDPMCANRVASAMRFTERAAMVVRIVAEEAGDRIWIPLSPPRLESADPFRRCS